MMYLVNLTLGKFGPCPGGGQGVYQSMWELRVGSCGHRFLAPGRPVKKDFGHSQNLKLAAPKVRKSQISRFLRSLIKQLICQKIFRKHMIRLQFFFKTNTLGLDFWQTNYSNTDQGCGSNTKPSTPILVLKYKWP